MAVLEAWLAWGVEMGCGDGCGWGSGVQEDTQAVAEAEAEGEALAEAEGGALAEAETGAEADAEDGTSAQGGSVRSSSEGSSSDDGDDGAAPPSLPARPMAFAGWDTHGGEAPYRRLHGEGVVRPRPMRAWWGTVGWACTRVTAAAAAVQLCCLQVIALRVSSTCPTDSV